MAKILIVDDKEQNLFVLRNFFRLFFKTANIEIIEAQDSVSTIKLIKEQRPDLVLLDIRLETDDAGLRIASEIKNDPQYKNTVIWAVTAQAMNSTASELSDRDKCLQAGCDDYITKPFDQIELVNKIANQLNIKSINHI
ncbi:MAG TPA: response regulator [Spirochaetota bacterium]|nr:response regulator [Spirochaetota bacterium]HOS33743.1 response regulator [Spirochaetota bacterium]HOS56169.1 response regulator [Spirochaetota bacterium]HPK63090.1 response regulator [Spirochaetota bacterium]HQF78590.1 response regulator [Spirochaetota bacterium]